MTADATSVICGILAGGHLPRGTQVVQLLDTARAHGVERLIASRTGRIDDDARAAAVLDELRVRELNRVLARLEQHGLEPVVFKGAALAHTHYPASWLRPRGDADVLVSPERRDEAAACLQSLGYVARPVVSGAFVSSQRPFAMLDVVGAEHVVDLHWRVANPHIVASVLTHAELAGRASSVDVRGHRLRVPAPPDALLLACVHRAAHHDDDDRLLWLYDIHVLATGLDAEEWATFLDEAVSRRVATLCWRGLSLAVDRFGTALPEDAQARLSGRAGREASARYLRRDVPRAAHLMADLWVLGPRAGARLLWEHLCPPASYMRAAFDTSGRAPLPALYVRRLASGVPRWLRGPR